MPFLNSLFRAVRKIHRRPRAHPRLMLCEPVRFQTPRAAAQAALLEDISSGGACIRTHLRLREGDAITLLLSLNSGLRLALKAAVVHCEREPGGYQSRCGLRFVGQERAQLDRIARFVIEQKLGRQIGVRSIATDRGAIVG